MWAAIAAAIAGISTWLVSKRNTDKTNAANKEMAQFQYSKDLEMWNKQNEYNSPQNQMQRLEQAHLSPNLVYQGGNVTGNTSGQMPKYQAPRMEYNYADPVAPAAAMISQFQDFRMKQEQTDNLKAQRKAIEANVLKTELANQFATGTMYDRTQKEFLGAHKLDREQQLLHQKVQMNEQLFPYQLSFQKGKNFALDTATQKMMVEMEKTQTATEFEKVKMDWYATQMMSNLGSAGAQIFKNLAPRAAGKIMGKPFSAGGAINPKSRERAFQETTRRMQEFGRH